MPGVRLIEADVSDSDTLKSLFTGCDAVINLIGIESPGLTASPAIARHVAALVAERG